MRWILVALVALASIAGGTISSAKDLASDSGVRKAFDVSGGPALDSLKQFSQQAGIELLYSMKDVEGVQTKAVKGDYLLHEALTKMLDGTGLVASWGRTKGALAVRRAGEADRPKTTPDRASELPPVKKKL